MVKTFTADVKHHSVLMGCGLVAGEGEVHGGDVVVVIDDDDDDDDDDGVVVVVDCMGAATSSVFSSIGRGRSDINDRMRQRLMLM